MTTPTPPEGGNLLPEELLRSGRAMYENDCRSQPSLSDKPWDQLTQKSRDNYALSFLSGLCAFGPLSEASENAIHKASGFIDLSMPLEAIADYFFELSSAAS